MKKLFLAKLSMLLMVMALIAAGCTKEGPQGPAGQDGTNGTNGTNGTDGTAGCIQCHDDSQAIEAKVLQWETSGHATGGAYFENATNCAPCHTSQGFLERMAAGTQATAAVIENPMPQNCYTCHNIHSTYTAEDLGLTYSAPVAFWFNPSGEATPDFGKGNLCSNCHQIRIPNPFPTVGSTDTYTVTSSRYGTHHGPMSNMLGGFSGFEVPGSLPYSNSPHTTVPDACVTCHLGTYDAEAMLGGHNMKANIASNCVSCHPDGIETEVETMQTEITGLLDQLATKLDEKGIRNPTSDLLAGDNGGNASSSNPANLSAVELGAWYNYKFVQEDRSLGVHNYKYAKALLTNSYQALSAFAAAK